MNHRSQNTMHLSDFGSQIEPSEKNACSKRDSRLRGPGWLRRGLRPGGPTHGPPPACCHLEGVRVRLRVSIFTAFLVHMRPPAAHVRWRVSLGQLTTLRLHTVDMISQSPFVFIQLCFLLRVGGFVLCAACDTATIHVLLCCGQPSHGW